jgi:hypothetical protein
MMPARNERYVLTSLRQQSTVIPANSSCAHDRDFHFFLLI